MPWIYIDDSMTICRGPIIAFPESGIGRRRSHLRVPLACLPVHWCLLQYEQLHSRKKNRNLHLTGYTMGNNLYNMYGKRHFSESNLSSNVASNANEASSFSVNVVSCCSPPVNWNCVAVYDWQVRFWWTIITIIVECYFPSHSNDRLQYQYTCY